VNNHRSKRKSELAEVSERSISTPSQWNKEELIRIVAAPFMLDKEQVLPL